MLKLSPQLILQALLKLLFGDPGVAYSPPNSRKYFSFPFSFLEKKDRLISWFLGFSNQAATPSFSGVVLKQQKDQWLVDLNHPLAGQRVNVTITLLATEAVRAREVRVQRLRKGEAGRRLFYIMLV